MENEIWKDISGFDGLYQVSSYGRIKSVERIVNFGSGKRIINEIIRKSKVKPEGYLSVIIYANHKQQTLYIHRLVAKEFCDGYDDKLQVNHKDGDRKNNYYENLEWVTRSQNQIHAFRTLKRTCYMSGRIGSLSHRAKPIAQYTLSGIFIRNFDCAATAQRELGIHESGIRKCLYGDTKQSGGFLWSYADKAKELAD